MFRNPRKILSCSFLLLSICAFSFCKKSTDNTYTPPPYQPPVDTAKYQLVWADEFDESAIDQSVWNFEIDGNGGGNHEQEYYKAENANIEDGNLVITAKKETVGS
jgi:beta-glucanase (GH16 family)